VLHELVNFLKAAFVKKQEDPFARREFTLRVLAGAPLLATARLRFGMTPPKFFDLLFPSHPEPDWHYSGELLLQASV
jgi:hypothetical protein